MQICEVAPTTLSSVKFMSVDPDNGRFVDWLSNADIRK